MRTYDSSISGFRPCWRGFDSFLLAGKLLNAGLGASLNCLYCCQYIYTYLSTHVYVYVSHVESSTYDEDCEEAVAAVACVRMALGPFLTAEMPAGNGVFERWRVVGFEVCLTARATCLAGGERSILEAARRSGEGERRAKRRTKGEQAQWVAAMPSGGQQHSSREWPRAWEVLGGVVD